MRSSRQSDLVVLVADVQQEKTLETLLVIRQRSLRIRNVTFQIFRHPRKDPGVFHEAADFLAPYHSSHEYALVLMDAAWDGAPTGGPDSMRSTLLEQMVQKGWDEDRCQAIVIEPELEAWVWAASNVVPLELRTTWDDIRNLADQLQCWETGQAKPSQPKELLETLLRQQRRPRSSALFQNLAKQVSLDGCQDPGFVLLRDTLNRWFGETPEWER